ncbi:leucine-rich repeat-containing protein 27-like [Tautogolabrus adspersus]
MISPSEMLCLSRTNLKHIPDSVLKNSKLKCLYLERNQITHVPGSLFISLPNLVWLDLRNNQIETLPAEIGSHRCLNILLLEGNPISELPAELGYVTTLGGLSLRDCPITFPPQDIVSQGVEGILQYLRSFLNKRPISGRKTPPVVELPLVEKLQLSELMGSSVEEQEESVDEEEELQRFRELKQEMILLDKAELGPIGQEDMKSHPPPVIKRKKAFGKAGIMSNAAATSQEALQVWRPKAKQDKPKKLSKPRNQEEADTDSKPGVEDSGGSLQVQTSRMTIREHEESRSVRELQRQICAHVETLQERRRNPRGSSSEQDMEEMRKLQTQLLERKKPRWKS